MNLTADQLIAIDRHLRKENWLLNEDLIAELTDHYVAGISDRMAQEQAFSEALIEVYKGFGWRKGLLNMEEQYGVQKDRQANLMEWRKMKTFFAGPRVLISVALFWGLYQLNSVDANGNGTKSFFSTGELSLLSGFCTIFFLVTLAKLQHSRVAGGGWAKSFGREIVPFIRVYSVCYGALLYGKFLGSIFSASLPSSLSQVINASLQTLTAVYFMGAFIATSKRLFPKSKIA